MEIILSDDFKVILSAELVKSIRSTLPEDEEIVHLAWNEIAHSGEVVVPARHFRELPKG